MTDKVRGQDVNVKLVRSDVRILSCHSPKTCIPERHGVNDPIRFCRRSQMLVSVACQFKCITQDAIDATPREDCLLDRHFLFGPFVEPAADVRVFPLIVFSDDAKFDLAGLPVLERALDSRKQANRPEIYVLPETAADWDKEAPQGNMIGNFGV